MTNVLDSLVLKECGGMDGYWNLKLIIEQKQKKEVIKISCEISERIDCTPKYWVVEPDHEWNNLFLKQVQALRIPLYQLGLFGNDGSSYELEVTAGGFQSFISWWGCLPEGYEELEEVLGMLVKKAGFNVDEIF